MTTIRDAIGPNVGALIPYVEMLQYRAEAPPLKTVTVMHDVIGRYDRIAPIIYTHFAQFQRKKHFRVLDVGACDRALGASLAKCQFHCTYHSLDVDRSTWHDFYDFADVLGSYDIICMFELIEHLSFGEASELLALAYRRLSPGGRLFISTPNPYHPTRYMSDVTHKQHWPSGDLFATLRHIGFTTEQVEMYGVIYAEPSPLRSLVALCRHFVWRLLGIDTRDGILVIATKDEA